MSVPKNKRNQSEMEFLHNAKVLRKQMTELLLRDFGIKAKNRDVKVFPNKYGMSKEDGAQFLSLCGQYEIITLEETYPTWLINDFRDNILSILRRMSSNIHQGNSIYPTCMSEWELRRKYQDEAVGDVSDLLAEMQYVIDIVPVDAKKYMPIVELIKREIALLKGWRKSDNKLKKKFETSNSKLNKIE